MKPLILLICVMSVVVGAEAPRPKLALSVALRAKYAGDAALRRNGSPIQTFFVSRSKKPEEALWVYWPEARYLIRFETPVDGDWDAIYQLGDYIDLESDFEKPGLGGVLISRSEVIREIQRCLQSERLVISTPEKKEPNQPPEPTR